MLIIMNDNGHTHTVELKAGGGDYACNFDIRVQEENEMLYEFLFRAFVSF